LGRPKVTYLVKNDPITRPHSNKLFRPDNETPVYIFFKPGPVLTTGRSKHSCGRVRIESFSNYYSVIAVGGIVATQLKSTEILDDPAGTWRSGPSLPLGISSAALVEDHTGGVILIGGTTSGYTFFLLSTNNVKSNQISKSQNFNERIRPSLDTTSSDLKKSTLRLFLHSEHFNSGKWHSYFTFTKVNLALIFSQI
jgi:hypothetical protein